MTIKLERYCLLLFFCFIHCHIFLLLMNIVNNFKACCLFTVISFSLRLTLNKISTTVFDLITAHTLISAQSRNSVVFRLQPVYFFLYFFTKAYVVGTHLN